MQTCLGYISAYLARRNGRWAFGRSWSSYLHYLRRWTADGGSHTFDGCRASALWQSAEEYNSRYHYHVLMASLPPHPTHRSPVGLASILLLPSSLYVGRIPIHSFNQTFAMRMAVSSQLQTRSAPGRPQCMELGGFHHPTPFQGGPTCPSTPPPNPIIPTIKPPQSNTT